MLAVDTETTGVAFYDEPFAATVTWRRPNKFVGANGQPIGELRSFYFELSYLDARIALSKILTRTPVWVGHNLKFDLQKLRLAGIADVLREERPIQVELHDTQTIYTLLDENRTKGLKDLAVRVLKYDDTIDVPYKSGPKAKAGLTRKVSREKHELDAARRKLKLKKEDGYHLLPRRVVVPYALKDTEHTLRLYETLLPRLEKKNDPDLMQLYRDSMRRKLTLLRMEAEGFALDLEYLEEKASEYGVRVMEAWARVVKLVGDPDFNPGSVNQLKSAFQERGISIPDTQAATLQKLDDDLARAILTYRDDKKTHTTYLVGLQREQRDGIVHPNFNDDGARTGRMSSGAAKE